jgi:hypothetical protein
MLLIVQLSCPEAFTGVEQPGTRVPFRLNVIVPLGSTGVRATLVRLAVNVTLVLTVVCVDGLSTTAMAGARGVTVTAAVVRLAAYRESPL